MMRMQFIKESRKVSFADNVETHEVPVLDPEEVADLFYSKLDFRGFKNDQILQQDIHISRAIRRFIENAVDDMGHRIAHAEKVQDIEELLVTHSRKLNREFKLGESRAARHEDEDMLYEEALRRESLRLDQEREQKISSQTDKTSDLSTKTREFIEVTSMMEDSCSSLLNFQPIDFEPELSSALFDWPSSSNQI